MFSSLTSFVSLTSFTSAATHRSADATAYSGFSMTPLQSWALMAMMAIAIFVVARNIASAMTAKAEQREHERQEQAQLAAEYDDEYIAALDGPRQLKRELYDWATQKI